MKRGGLFKENFSTPKPLQTEKLGGTESHERMHHGVYFSNEFPKNSYNVF